MQSLFSCIGKRFSCLHLCSDGAGSTTRISRESPKKDKDRFGLQKEVLESLFCVPERSTQVPKIIHVVRPERRPRGDQEDLVNRLLSLMKTLLQGLL